MSLDTEVLHVIQNFLSNVRRSGPDNVAAICPFHVKMDGRPEATPSFAISLVTGLWICHSCHERGTLRTFLRDIGVSRRVIDTFYKPLLEQVDSRAARQHKKECRIFHDMRGSVLEEAILGFFENCPLALLEEGFSEDTLKHFDVGYDTKNNRITFPIRDILGRVVGISGRSTMSGQGGRYKVYSKYEYEAWGLTPVSTDKSNILWNAFRVYPGTFHNHTSELVVVEGFKACMWAWQCGFKNVVALMGSFLSPYQKAVIERMGADVYLFLDNGDAGEKGTFYAGKELQKTLTTKVVTFSENQPTDLSPQQVQEAVLNAVDYTTWATARSSR